jgi:hypothetical protein
MQKIPVIRHRGKKDAEPIIHETAIIFVKAGPVILLP